MPGLSAARPSRSKVGVFQRFLYFSLCFQKKSVIIFTDGTANGGKTLNRVKIISDSTCDLSPELLERYDIAIVPLHILLGDTEYEDGFNLTPEEIYAWSDAHKATPKTSAPDPEHTEDILREFIDRGQDVVCFSIASGMSTSGNVLRLAAESIGAADRVTVIDSANLSTGIGLLVIEAAEMAAEGADAAEIQAAVERYKPLVRASFVVDTLTYLHRGGRCSGLAALAGGALKLHPRIAVVDGAMRPERKYRGKMQKVVLDYARDMESALRSAKPDRVFITHSGCDEASVAGVREYLVSLGVFREILVTRAGGVISSHCGPGTLGVLFIAGE